MSDSEQSSSSASSDNEQTEQTAQSSSSSSSQAAKPAPAPLSPPPEPRMKGVYALLPYLLIGSADVAVTLEELQHLGVQRIMNCASEDVDNMFEDHFEYTAYPIDDTHEGDPSEFFEDSVEVIFKAKEDQARIFVHCTEGKTIAPTIIANYMMQSAKRQNKHLSLQQALNFLSAKAPGIKIPDYFLVHLADAEYELFEENSVKVKTSRARAFGSSRVGVGRGGGKGRGGKGRRGK